MRAKNRQKSGSRSKGIATSDLDLIHLLAALSFTFKHIPQRSCLFQGIHQALRKPFIHSSLLLTLSLSLFPFHYLESLVSIFKHSHLSQHQNPKAKQKVNRLLLFVIKGSWHRTRIRIPLGPSNHPWKIPETPTKALLSMCTWPLKDLTTLFFVPGLMLVFVTYAALLSILHLILSCSLLSHVLLCFLSPCIVLSFLPLLLPPPPVP